MHIKFIYVHLDHDAEKWCDALKYSVVHINNGYFSMSRYLMSNEHPDYFR